MGNRYWEGMPAARQLGVFQNPPSPVGVVQHFTAGGSGRDLARWIAGKTKHAPAEYFAHVIICRDGHIIQQVEFDQVCYHAAGVSRGRVRGVRDDTELNRCLLGIENSNYGWLIEDGGAFFVPRKEQGVWVPGKKYPDKYPHPERGVDHRGVERWWEPFTQELIQSNIEVMRSMVRKCPAIRRENVFRHSDLSPDRKMDPGPLFPFNEILGEVYETQEDDEQDFQDQVARRHYDPDEEICLFPEEVEKSQG